MGFFSKGKNSSKFFKNLDNKIKNLDEDLKKTGVIIDNGDIISSSKNLADQENYSWKKGLIEEEQVKTKEEILEEEVSLIRENTSKKNKSLKRVDKHIESISEEYAKLKKEIFNEISEDFLYNIPSIENKLNKVLEVYDQIQEGLLNQPPETDNEDPLTPLNQEFVTVDELNKHYNLFINRIQEQIATVGGGGEVQLKWLDDIVGIATNASAYDGNYLRYNHSSGKFVFEPVGAGGTWAVDDVGINTTKNVGIGTTARSDYRLYIDGDTKISGNISVGGTITYEDVTNVDSIGFITARSGIRVLSGGLSVESGITTLGNTIVGGATTELIVNGDARITGILTIGTSSITLDGNTNELKVGTAVTISEFGSITFGSASISGISTFTGDVKLNSALVDFYGNVGAASSVLISTGVGVSWISIAEAALQGIQGADGSQGIQGANGIQGTTGSQGVDGTQGVQGTTGSQGVQGTTGDQGIQGTTGSQGADGTQGSDGIQGITGDQGIQGTTGSQGTDGTQGSDGIQGTQGLQGELGATGDQGIQGIQGTTGSQGTQGLQGQLGATGDQGIQGIQGTTGSQGADGAQGVQGITGDQGIQGTTGSQGTDGTQGVQGTTGSQGIQGTTGSQGADGTQGVQGTTGSQGIQGIQGILGPLVGSANQVIFKDGSNNPSGSDNLTFDGTKLSTSELFVVGDVSIGGTLTYEDVTNIDSVGFITARSGIRVISGGLNVSSGVATFGSNIELEAGIIDLHGNVGTASSVLVSTGAGVSWTQISEAALQGVQGTTGSQGTDGTQGIQGTTGSQGTDGTQGVQGTTGSQGTDGTQGVQGTTGSQGTDGTQGVQGITGDQGIQGTTGSQGTDGTQGVQGITGDQGVQGTTGSQGTDGTQGVQGTTGSQGIQGTTGSQGTDGTQGVQGTTGSQGIQGIQGLQGVQSTQGLQGLQGLQGVLGDSYWVETNIGGGEIGIHTTSNVGVGTTNPQSILQVQRYGVETGFIEHTSQVGIKSDIDSFDVSSLNFLTAEYTLHVGFGTHIQSQKVLVMQNGEYAYAQEYGVMYQPDVVVSFGATMTGSIVTLQATPETGVTGVTTYRFVRGTML